jgi:peptidoglycan-associated lipoprotein
MNKLLILCASLLIVACSSPAPKPVVTQAPQPVNEQSSNHGADMSAAASASAVSAAIPAEAPISPEAAASAKLAAELQVLHNESVYFDFDESVVKTEFRAAVEKHATDLKNSNSRVVLEGNADERGSVAYNLALGERRSTSVKKVLVQLGVPVSNIMVVSFGNTRPKLACHEEKCWHENRRVDFVPSQN